MSIREKFANSLRQAMGNRGELAKQAAMGGVSSRYRVEATGETRSIVSISAPNVHLRIEPGLIVNEKGLKSFDSQAIFLDGAFAGPLFHNNEKRQYSLDHHTGCLRSIMLSTCEQAAAVLLTGTSQSMKANGP